MANEVYKMPEPYDNVNWTYHPGRESLPAIVTERGNNVISVIVFPKGFGSFEYHENVRHISDPWIKENLYMLNPSNGVWDYTERDKVIDEVIKFAETFDPETFSSKKTHKKNIGKVIG